MPGQRLYLSRADEEAAGVSAGAMISAVRLAFAEMASGRVEVPPKLSVHPGPSPGDFINAMAAYLCARKVVGLKWVAAYSSNQALGVPYINALMILSDAETGAPFCVMDGAWLTAQRTAAVSALSAEYLARPESEVLAILGCGVEGKAHLTTLAEVMPSIRSVIAYDPDTDRARTLAGMARDRGLEASVAEAAREAVREADVVVTAGPILRPPHATIKAGWLKPGAFGCAVDYDSYFDRAAVEECRLATDDRVQFAEFIRSGYLDVPEPDADLGELVTGRRQGRERPEQKTMAMNLGSALVDVAVADLVYRHCAQAGLGLLLPD